MRLGVTYPEITEMQMRAILEAAGELLKAGKKAYPEIMIPVTCNVTHEDEVIARGALHHRDHGNHSHRTSVKKLHASFSQP